MKLSRVFALATLAGSVCFSNTATFAEDSEDKVLTIGDSAPTLDIEHWVQDNEGTLKPVNEFTKGQVYIVEFWATWCGPCIASMPHLAETQQKYDADKVRLISVSDEDLETVETFLKRTVRGEEEMTYKDLTKVYSLTTDPDRSVYQDYMRAAGQNGIPTAFIVGKTGKVEWIGHPMSMDKPLEEVIADSWDRESFGKEFKKRQEAQLMMAKLQGLMRGSKEDKKEALKMIEAALAELAEGPSMERMQLERMYIPALAGSGNVEKAAKAIDDAIASADDNVGSVMNAVQNLMMLPPEFDAETRTKLIAVAIKRINKLMDSEAVKKDSELGARIQLTVGQIYLSAKDSEGALKALNTAKELTSDERLQSYVKSMTKAAEAMNKAEEGEDEAKDDK